MSVPVHSLWKTGSEAVNPAVFGTEIIQKGFGGHFAAAYPPYDLTGIVYTSVAVDFFLQPCSDLLYPAFLQNAVQVSQFLFYLFQEHTVIDGTQQIGREIAE